MKFNSYKDLIAWQKAILLTKEVYKTSRLLPESERFNLISQINRSVVSVPSNIAEGWGRESKNSYINFLKIARGSLYELETQSIIVKELNFCTEEILNPIFELITEEIKILNGLIKSITLTINKTSNG
jgi:four helix bundle protein